MSTPATTPAEAPKIDVVKERADARKAEQERIREITAIGDKFDLRELAQKHVTDGTELEAFRTLTLAELEKQGQVRKVDSSPEIGMSKKEIKNYSLLRMIRAQASPDNRSLRDAAKLEIEASEAVRAIVGTDPKGFYIPSDVTMDSAVRALNVTTATAGGFLVQTTTAGQSMIELLRNKTRVIQLGASVLSGLVGNVAIPKQTGGATAYWLTESGTLTASDQTFGQLALTPKRLGAATGFSKQLLAQSSPDVENIVRSDLMKVLAIEEDRAAINGLGAAGEPLGILNTNGINATVTFGGAPTWADVVEFETGIATDNADVGVMGFLTTPAVRGKWKTTVKESGTSNYLWPENGMPNGYRAEVSKQVPSDKVIFGVWSELIIAHWDGMDVVVDPYSLSLQNQVRVVIHLMSDIAIRQPLAFNASTDSGAQ